MRDESILENLADTESPEGASMIYDTYRPAGSLQGKHITRRRPKTMGREKGLSGIAEESVNGEDPATPLTTESKISHKRLNSAPAAESSERDESRWGQGEQNGTEQLRSQEDSPSHTQNNTDSSVPKGRMYVQRRRLSSNSRQFATFAHSEGKRISDAMQSVLHVKCKSDSSLTYHRMGSPLEVLRCSSGGATFPTSKSTSDLLLVESEDEEGDANLTRARGESARSRSIHSIFDSGKWKWLKSSLFRKPKSPKRDNIHPARRLSFPTPG